MDYFHSFGTSSKHILGGGGGGGGAGRGSSDSQHPESRGRATTSDSVRVEVQQFTDSLALESRGKRWVLLLRLFWVAVVATVQTTAGVVGTD